MQKVSKQSLAMIALSILLAISIALTFTFAVFSGAKKANGTITFSGGFTLATANFANNDNDDTRSFAITPTIAADGTISYAINENEAAWTITTTDSQELGITITYTTGTNGTQDPVSLKGVTNGKQYYLAVDANTATIKLEDIISLAKNNTAANVNETSLTYTINVAVVSISDKGSLTKLPDGVATLA